MKKDGDRAHSLLMPESCFDVIYSIFQEPKDGYG